MDCEKYQSTARTNNKGKSKRKINGAIFDYITTNDSIRSFNLVQKYSQSMSSQQEEAQLTINSSEDPMKLERQKVLYSVILSGLLVFILWIIKLLEWNLSTDFRFLANLPRHLSHLHGIITEPFVHGDFNHLISNSVPLFLLLSATLYFYRNIAFKVVAWIWLFTGLGVWLFARENYHIGASGIVYGLAAFHAFSGILRRDMRLMAISLLVVFLYGGMIWGVFPIFHKMSWESHLMGSLSGVFVAVAYRNLGPQKTEYFFDDDDEPEIAEEHPLEQEVPSTTARNPWDIPVTYHYIEKKGENEKK
jgi:membrane associated rhomboid family serine protease